MKFMVTAPQHNHTNGGSYNIVRRTVMLDIWKVFINIKKLYSPQNLQSI